jgi:hypothetical protein
LRERKKIMPAIAEQLASYATNLHYRDIPSETAHLAKRRLADAELEEKFHTLTGAVLERLWHLEDVADMGEVVKLTQMATRSAGGI